MIRLFDIKVYLLRKYIRIKQKQISIQCFDTCWDKYVIRHIYDGYLHSYGTNNKTHGFALRYVEDADKKLIVYDKLSDAVDELKEVRYKLGTKIIRKIKSKKYVFWKNLELYYL